VLGVSRRLAICVKATQMPIYEFECDNENCEANARYEKELSIAEPHDLECPFCHASMRKVYSSVPAVHFKGSGFYSTDSK
jgi:putative FmdB family regulatory protein